MATTLKVPPELKVRVAQAARSAGKSPHAFMLDAIEQQTTLAERRRSFVQQAMRAREEGDRTGKAHDAAEVHAYLAARVKGKKAARPRLRSWRG